MRFVRTILILAVSVSLAMLPLGASAANSAISSGDTHASMQMDVAIGMPMDCCPDDMKGSPSHTHDKCDTGFCCAAGVVGLHCGRAAEARIALVVCVRGRALHV